MNHAYRLVWSDAGQSYIAVPEFARARGKRSSIVAAVCAATFLAGGPARALAPDALPSGGVVKGGQAEISQSGAAMTIRQTTPNVAIDWPSYSIGEKASVNYIQPNAAAIALNRVTGQNPTQILGSLTANGQVFIVNPAGVLFGQGAQVNAQGILASTRDIDVADFMAGNYRFAGSGKGTVDNAGKLIAGKGGYVALIGAQVSNVGEIHAPSGDVRLAAADRVAVVLDNGSLAGFTVERGTLDALAANGGLIRADGGRVYLTADAADSLAGAVVNNTGIIEARGVEDRNGTIVLLADMQVGTANVAGTLDAGTTGFVETSGHRVKIADGTRVKARRWLIDPVDFTIAATGGDISGATLSANLGTADVEIQSSSGGTAGNGDINVNDAVGWNANTLTLTAARDININAVMTAGGTSRLVMNTATANGADAGVAGGTVRVGFNSAGRFKGRVDFPGRSGTGFLTINGEGYTVIDALGSAGSVTALDLQGMNGNLAGRYALGANIDATATAGWNGGWGFGPIGTYATSFTGKFDGLGHTIANLTINRPMVELVGLFGFTQGGALRNVGLVDADVTGLAYVGTLLGWNDTLAIRINNTYATGLVTSAGVAGGLVGSVDKSNIDRVNADVDVSGAFGVGGLAGYLGNASLRHAYAIGSVDATGNGVGGLVGLARSSNIDSVYASGTVSGDGDVGGLVGGSEANSAIANAYATGTARGNMSVGGLVGSNSFSSIDNSYATGLVTLTPPLTGGTIGGLVGSNTGSVTASFWNTETSWQPASAGGTGKTSAEMMQLATFSGWDIDAAAGTGTTWRIYEGQTAPLLRSFLTPVTLAPAYDGGAHSYANIAAYSNTGVDAYRLVDTNAALILASTATAGTATATLGGYASTQRGYDISYASRTLTGTGSAANDLRIGSDLAWSAGTLTLNAQNDIRLAAVLTASGSSKLAMNTTTGAVKADFNAGGGFKGWVDFPGRSGTGFLTINGEGYTVIDALGVAGDTSGTTLQGIDGNLTGNYALGGDIDASLTAGWNGGAGFSPLGGSSSIYSGQFNGLGHTISNLFINRESNTFSNIGLFAYSSWANTLRNIGLVNADVRSWGAVTPYGSSIGVLAGNGRAANSYATGSVAATRSDRAGGLIGVIFGTVPRGVSDSYAAVNVTGYSNAGGLVGYVYGSTADISDSYATGSVSGVVAGGLVGVLGSTTPTAVRRSHATGNVTGTDRAGGLVGFTGAEFTVEESYATGNVTGGNMAGGLIGRVNWGLPYGSPVWTVARSFASGNVAATAAGGSAGGLIGYMARMVNGNVTISDSYATGTVSGDSGVGGLIGGVDRLNSLATNLTYTLTRSYATGRVTGAANTGGLVGFQGAGATLDAATSVWDSQATGQAASAGNKGTGRTSAEMKQLATYAGWNIDDAGGTGKVWRIYEGDSAPLLRSFLAPATVASRPVSQPADGGAYAGTASAFSVPGAAPSRLRYGGNGVGASAAGSYDLRVYSGQQGYDLIGTRNTTLTLTPAAATAGAAAPAAAAAAAAQTPAYSGALVAASQPIIAGDAAKASAAGAIPAGRGAQLPPQAAPVAAQSGAPASSSNVVALLADATGLPLASMRIVDGGLRLPEPGPFDLVRREDNR